MSRLCIIPARGGSRRIKHKNIRMFYGKPIIWYSIATAKRTGMFDRIIVSTDDDIVAEIAHKGGAEIHRRSEADSRDEVGTQTVICHVVQHYATTEEYRPDFVCGIYATCPMLTVGDLHDGFDLLWRKKASFTFSVGTEPLADAGMFYWGTATAFAYGEPLISPNTVMVPIPSNRVCDINDERDWIRAEAMYDNLHREKA